MLFGHSGLDYLIRCLKAAEGRRTLTAVKKGSRREMSRIDISFIKLLIISGLIASIYGQVNAAELSNDPLPTVQENIRHIRLFSLMSGSQKNGRKGMLKERFHCCSLS